MPAMTDPANALALFQEAFAQGLIPVEQGRIDPNLLFAPDDPNGRPRFNYMRANGKTLSVLVMFAHSGMIEGHPCFSIGYAVAKAYRGRRLAKSTLVAALAEFTNGLAGAGIPIIHIEAVVGTDNLLSQRVATALFEEPPAAITDSKSGLPALHYIRQIHLSKDGG